jgi:hypothetical protein
VLVHLEGERLCLLEHRFAANTKKIADVSFIKTGIYPPPPVFEDGFVVLIRIAQLMDKMKVGHIVRTALG